MPTDEVPDLRTVLTRTVTRSEIPELLESVALLDPLRYLMASWWDGPGLFDFYTSGIDSLRLRKCDCVAGSAFGDATDVTWREIDGENVRVLLVSATDLSSLCTGSTDWRDSGDCGAVSQVNQRIVLWGTQCEEKPIDDVTISLWREQRIPRPLGYPVPASAFGKGTFDAAVLLAKEYRDIRGRSVLYRRRALEATLASLPSAVSTGR